MKAYRWVLLAGYLACYSQSNAQKINVVEDTSIKAGNEATKNFGTLPMLDICRGQLAERGYAAGLLKFDLTDLPKTDHAILLNLHVAHCDTPADLMVWISRRNNWKESSVTYNTDPYIAAPYTKAIPYTNPETPVPLRRVAVMTKNTWIAVDVTEAVADARERGVLSLYLMSGELGVLTPRSSVEAQAGLLQFSSKESGKGAYLSVSDAPPIRPAKSSHPIVFIQNNEKEQLKENIATSESMQACLTRTQETVDAYLQKIQLTPDYLLSRMQLWWNEHYATTDVPGWTQPIRGFSGTAMLPSLRWCSQATPKKDAPWFMGMPPMERRKPYDSGDTIFASYHNEEKDFPFVACGWASQVANADLAGIARDAAFLYWYTGEDKYGALATDILWQLCLAVYFTNIPDHDFCGIGSTETIHDNMSARIPQAYDFLYNYLYEKKIPTAIFEFAMRRAAKNWLYRGHGANWTIWETAHMAPIVSLIQEDNAYADGLGRSAILNHILYEDVLNPAFNDKRTHESLATAQKQYHPASGIKTESPGYSQGSAPYPITFLLYLRNTGDILEKADLEFLFKQPFGYYAWSDTMGGIQAFSDLPQRHKYSRSAMEKLAMMANAKGDKAYIKRLAQLYNTYYPKKEGQADDREYKEILDLCMSNSLLVDTEIDPTPSPRPRSFYAPFQNNVLSRGTIGFGKYASMISMYGEGVKGHDQPNGLSMECHFLGKPLLVDWGGSSYRTGPVKWHLCATPAHNTVVVRGFDCPRKLQPPKFNWIEPRLTDADQTQSAWGIHPDCNLIDASMNYNFSGKPERKKGATSYRLIAKQRRLLGMIRTSPKAVWFIDFFHSDELGAEDLFHDYIYNPLGVFAGAATKRSKILFRSIADDQGLGELANEHDAYDYYTERRKAAPKEDFWSMYKGADDFYIHALLANNGAKKDVYLAYGYKSDVYGVNSIRGANSGGKDKRQVCIIRQQGEAWDRPFVMVYEATETPQRTIQQVITDADQAEWQAVSFKGSDAVNGQVVHVVHSLTPTQLHTYAGIKFNAEYAVIGENAEGGLNYLYLGEGRQLAHKGYALDAGSTTMAACLRLEEGKIMYSQAVAGDITISLPLPEKLKTPVEIILTHQGEPHRFSAEVQGKSVIATLSGFIGADASLEVAAKNTE